jgi:FMN phosphatase YigB (HAD superfamily)
MDPFHAVAELKISLADFRRELEELQSKFLHVFEDAIALIKALKNKGYGLYVSSNNSLSRAYAALHRTGLSDWDKSECFGGVFCPENIGFNKSNSQFYTKLIETGGFNPNEMLVIGDSMRDDGESPLEAGVKHAIIIDRKNKLENKNIPIVNDLRDLLEKGDLI